MKKSPKKINRKFSQSIFGFTKRIFDKYQRVEKMLSFPLLIYLRTTCAEPKINSRVIYQTIYGRTPIQELFQYIFHYFFHFDSGHILTNNILAELINYFTSQQSDQSKFFREKPVDYPVKQQRSLFTYPKTIHRYNIAIPQQDIPVPGSIERLHKFLIRQYAPFHLQESPEKQNPILPEMVHEKTIPDALIRIKDVIWKYKSGRLPVQSINDVTVQTDITANRPSLIPLIPRQPQDNPTGTDKKPMELFAEENPLPFSSAKPSACMNTAVNEKQFTLMSTMMLNTITDKIIASQSFEKQLGKLLSKKITKFTEQAGDAVKKMIQLDEHRKGYS